MNLGRAAIVLRPRSLLELIDLSCRFVFGLEPQLFLKLFGSVLAPCIALCAALHFLAGVGWPTTWLAALGLGTVAQGAFTVASGRLMFSDSLSARDVLGRFARRLLTYLSALATTRVMIALGFATLVLGPLAWVRAAFVHEAVLLEEAFSSAEAVRRSARFTADHTSTTFQMLLLLSLTWLIAIGTAELLGHGVIEFALQLGRPFGSLVDEGGSLYALIGFFGAIPFTATARFLAYVDARTRRDGWDIQIQFLAIESAAEERITT